MPAHHLELSIVIAAKDCNPTIVNPDFLQIRGIVNEQWGWSQVGSPLTTPPFARVSYDSGVSIIVEANRFLVQKKLENEPAERTKIPEIAHKYIETLPHVRYTGVGHNFRSFFENDDADSYIRSKFLNDKSCINSVSNLESASIKLIYSIKDGLISLSVDSAILHEHSPDDKAQKTGVIVTANFHRKCNDYPGEAVIQSYVDNFSSDWDQYKTILSEVFGDLE